MKTEVKSEIWGENWDKKNSVITEVTKYLVLWMLKPPLISLLKLPCWWSIWLQNLLFFNPWWTSFTTFACGGLSRGLIRGLFRGLCWFSMFFIWTWVFGPVSFGLFSMFGFGFLQSDPKLKIPFRNSWV